MEQLPLSMKSETAVRRLPTGQGKQDTDNSFTAQEVPGQNWEIWYQRLAFLDLNTTTLVGSVDIQ